MIKGNIDRLRIQRLNAWKICEAFRGTRDMPSITEFYGLAGDKEIVQGEAEEQRRSFDEAMELYRQVQQSNMLENKWWEKN